MDGIKIKLPETLVIDLLDNPVEQATPEIAVGENGLISATATQEKGSVSGGTKITVKQLETESGKEIVPTREVQTAVKKGKYTTDDVKVLPIPNEYIIPSGSLDIDENGEYNVLDKESVKVNIQSGGTNKLAQVIDRSVTDITADDLAWATEIGEYALFRCLNLKKIDIPNHITKIGSHAFQECPITSVNIHNNITRIEDYVFALCKLESIAIPDSVTTIGMYAFQGNKFTSLIIPDNVTVCGSNAFSDCTLLENVNISKGLENIAWSMFAYCISLKSVIIPNNIKQILSQAFQNCSQLASIYIGNGVTNMYSTTFKNCNALTDIYIDAPENSIEGSPWGATNATVHWNTPLPSEGEATLISFTIEGTEYQAEEGMTWGEWQTSEYNTVGLDEDILIDGKFVVKSGTVTFEQSDFIIIEGQAYETRSAASGGGND